VREKHNQPEETTERETATLKFKLAPAEELEEGMFRGVASAFDTLIDTYIPTFIKRGAFKETIKKDRARIKILWQHDPDKPIGLPEEMKETDEGLEITARISDTLEGRDALTLMRDGVVDDLSIGFDPLKWTIEKRPDLGDVRIVSKARLWEISPVTHGANPKAKILEVNEQGGETQAVVNGTDTDTSTTGTPVGEEAVTGTITVRIIADEDQGLDPSDGIHRLGEAIEEIRKLEVPVTLEQIKELEAIHDALGSIIEQERKESPEAVAARAAATVHEAELALRSRDL
jgi:HK97 family phage prohead protease